MLWALVTIDRVSIATWKKYS